MAKLTLIVALILAIAVLGNAQREQRWGFISRGSREFYRTQVSRGGIVNLPYPGNQRRIGAVIVTHLRGAEGANASISRGGPGSANVTIAFQASRIGNVNATVALWTLA